MRCTVTFTLSAAIVTAASLLAAIQSVAGDAAGPLGARTALSGCRTVGTVAEKKNAGGACVVTRTVADAKGRRAIVSERFTSVKDAIRWEIEVVGEGAPWSAPIITSLHYPAKTDTLFWTAWDAPPHGDLLTPAPLSEARRYAYGAPRFTLEKPGMPWFCCQQRPGGEHFISLPLITLIEPGASGLSVVASPEPIQFDIEMALDRKGIVSFTWYRHRISKTTPVRLALDIVKHEDDWRGGVRWMTGRYGQFFDPPNPGVHAVAGCGNYSQAITKLDVPALRRMAFTVNWNAEFDWPYLGMYLPPVTRDASWRSWRGRPTSIQKIDDYSKAMRADGFHVLNYFNVTEFGAKIAPPKPRKPDTQKRPANWNDANDFLFNRLGPAILRVPEKLNLPPDVKWPQPAWAKTCRGGLYYSWEESVVMDCGEPVFRDFLLDQARRHVAELPDSSGIAIDRTDWLRIYNLDRDDGVSWFDESPARSLVWSWRTLMETLGPIMHNGGKAIFVNTLDKRLDLMRQVDGIFDECPGINGDALLGLRKPVLIFNGAEKDDFLQNCLYLGVYPMCPVPGNDHGLGWGTRASRQPFLDYGPLLATLRGRKWVLAPHCVETATPAAKVNLFEVPGGYVLPVALGGKAKSAAIRVRNVPGLERLRAVALHPGADATVPVAGTLKDGVLSLAVPLVRGCAVVRLTN